MRKQPHVLSTRVTAQQLSAIRLAAADRKCSVSALVGSAVRSAVQLTRGTETDPDSYAKLEAVMKALGLSPSTKLQDVSAALVALIEAVGTGDGAADPVTSEPPDVQPAQLAQRTARRVARASSDPLAAPRAARLAAHNKTRR